MTAHSVDETPLYGEHDHQAAYIFEPQQQEADNVEQSSAKRRKVTTPRSKPKAKAKAKSTPRGRARGKRGSEAQESTTTAAALEDGGREENGEGGEDIFTPLLRGAESSGMVIRRQRLFEEAWGKVEDRIQKVLRYANQTTLMDVEEFMARKLGSGAQSTTVPAALIMTGPNLASQDLLFEQLAEKLGVLCRCRVVRIRAVEATNLKATLKKIIRDAVGRGEAGSGGDVGEDGDDQDVSVGHDGRKYLDYDLEALHAYVKPDENKNVIIAFEDSEAFDNILLADLISLFHSWRDRIHIGLLFGIATSSELFQARLLKSTCQQLDGGQFDVVQASSILDSIVKCGVASSGLDVRIGPSLLRMLVERQTEQVAGTQIFVNSLKYAHMCHFYANALSPFVSPWQDQDDELARGEYVDALRALPSFRRHVEDAVEEGRLRHAKSLLNDDKYLSLHVSKQLRSLKDFSAQLLRSLHLLLHSGIEKTSFTEAYMAALSVGIDADSSSSRVPETIKTLSPDDALAVCQKLQEATEDGNLDLYLDGWAEDAGSLMMANLKEIENEITLLQEKARESGHTLRSSYTAQSKVLRTTVIAQKVQLSQDSARLSEQDKSFTAAIDRLLAEVTGATRCPKADSLFLHEIWMYESKAPYRDVFVPSPGVAMERALSRPQDFLGDNAKTMPPATSTLYRLYTEAGSLINVADLWSAFHAAIVDEDDGGCDERTALVLFYRALAELRALGFVKGSRKKADHIAKVKWL